MFTLARCAAVLLSIIAAGSAQAATYTVTNLSNSGSGSLRQAMLSANATAAADEIVIAVTGVITLTSPLPDIVEAGGDLIITGDGRPTRSLMAAGRIRSSARRIMQTACTSPCAG